MVLDIMNGCFSMVASSSDTSVDDEIWHARLGHLNFKSLKYINLVKIKLLLFNNNKYILIT